MSDPWEDDLLYDLRNPPVMSMVVSRDDLYAIMATRMGKAADELDRLRAENARLREALTPGADTKAAYMGEFHMGITLRHPRTGEEDRRRAQIPWDTIKEIMAAIRARAAIAKEAGE